MIFPNNSVHVEYKVKDGITYMANLEWVALTLENLQLQASYITKQYRDAFLKIKL